MGKTQGQLIFGWIREARELYPGDEDQQVLYVRRKKAEHETPIERDRQADAS